MNNKNRKGLIRIIEASIAILVILTVLIILAAQRNAPESADIGKVLPGILEEIAQDNSLRQEIIDYSGGAIPVIINDTVKDKIGNIGLGYEIKICDKEDICSLDSIPEESGGEIFAHERVISATLTDSDFSPKKIKVFLWRKR